MLETMSCLPFFATLTIFCWLLICNPFIIVLGRQAWLTKDFGGSSSIIDFPICATVSLYALTLICLSLFIIDGVKGRMLDLGTAWKRWSKLRVLSFLEVIVILALIVKQCKIIVWRVVVPSYVIFFHC